jgi:hypothetical protein
MNSPNSKTRIQNFLSPDSGHYLAVTLIVSILSCVGTWIAPQLITTIVKTFSVSSLPASINDPNTHDPSLYMVVSIGWVMLVVIGSVSLWAIAIILIRIIGNVFELSDWRDLFSNKEFSRVLVAAAFLYLLITVYISALRFSSLASVVLVVGSQAAGMILIGGFVIVIAFIVYWGISGYMVEVTKKASSEHPEMLSDFDVETDLPKALNAFRESMSKESLKYLLIGLVVGAILGGYGALFLP